MKREGYLVRRLVDVMVGVVIGVATNGCVPPAPPEQPAPPPPRKIFEEEVKPAETLAIEIVDLNETPSPDRTSVTVTGRVINRGTRPTHEVQVRVEALDKDGAVIASAVAQPSTELIAPDATATFSVSFESRPEIDRYHVEAISR